MGFVPNINICYALRYSVMGEKYRIAPNMGKQEILQGEKENIKCQGLIRLCCEHLEDISLNFERVKLAPIKSAAKCSKYMFVFFVF